MDIDVGYQEEMRIIDRRAYLLNQRLDWCKVIGLAVFCVGGTLLSASLILPSLTGLSCIDDDNGDEEHQPFKLRIVDDDENVNNDDEKIPATEQVKSIQPKREDEMVITKTGLTKVEWKDWIKNVIWFCCDLLFWPNNLLWTLLNMKSNDDDSHTVLFYKTFYKFSVLCFQQKYDSIILNDVPCQLSWIWIKS